MKKSCTAIIVNLYIAAVLFAQQSTGNIEGFLVDLDSSPVSGVNIIVSSSSLPASRGAISDSKGRFLILSLPVGDYNIQISHVACQPVELRDIAVHLGKTSALGVLRLERQTIKAPSVTIIGTYPALDPGITEQGGNLTASQFTQLPVERDYRNLPALLPQANLSYFGDGINLAGATGLETKYIVNGVDVTDPFRGISGTGLPYNFIREVEVKTSGYQAEHRGALGGIVNVITFSGGNQFQGQVFGFFSNDRFTGERRAPMFGPPQGAFSQYDAGLRIGGPLVRDKLWVFAAYNPIWNKEQVYLPGLKHYPDKSTTHCFAGKLTWQAGKHNNLALTISGDPQHRRGVGETYMSFGAASSFLNPDPYLEDIHRGGINLSLTGRHIITDHFLLETFLSRLTRREDNKAATQRGATENLFIDLNGEFSGGVPVPITAHS